MITKIFKNEIFILTIGMLSLVFVLPSFAACEQSSRPASANLCATDPFHQSHGQDTACLKVEMTKPDPNAHWVVDMETTHGVLDTQTHTPYSFPPTDTNIYEFGFWQSWANGPNVTLIVKDTDKNVEIARINVQQNFCFYGAGGITAQVLSGKATITYKHQGSYSDNQPGQVDVTVG